jgi:hypothetical protein
MSDIDIPGRSQHDARNEEAARAVAASSAGEDPRTVEDLKAELRALNDQRGPDDQLPLSGSKADLVARLRVEG